MKITLLRIDKMRTNFIFYKKSTITLLFLVVFSMFGSSQTTFSWRNDQNPTSGQWNVSNYWWNGSGAALPSGGEILFLDGSVGTTMTNDLPSTNRFRIIFGSGGSSRVVNGTIENTFYDYGSNKPKIENNSSAAQTINFPVKAGYNPLELNPINGDLTIYSSINNDGNYIDIYGPNNKVLTLSGTIIGSGGISLKQNSKLVLSTNAKSYTGATVLEAGTLDLSISLASSVITVNSGSKLFITGTDVTINDLTIETGGVVEVQAGKALTVTGTLTNKAGAGGLVVKSGGSLIQKSAIQATVERDIPAWTSVPHGWHFLSSPVAAQAISPDFTNAAATNYDFYAWREPDNTWINFKNTSTSPTWNETNGNTSFAPGKGYLVAYASSGTKQFSGTLNNTDVTVSNLGISAGTNKGWHLLGNPFSSAITWSACSRTHINATAKLWNDTTAAYVDITSGVIPLMNGFMVQVSTSPGSITFPTTARVHNAKAWYKSGEAQELLLVATDPEGKTAQESKIRMEAASTTGFDTEFDSHFLAGYAPQLYSTAGDELLSTNSLPSLPAESIIPFGFVKNESSQFSIELKQNIDGYTPYLKDLKTNTIQNLVENPVYTFTSEAGDDPNRFELRFMTPTGLDKASTQSTIRVYSTNGKINISGVDGKAEVFVRNLVGQVFLRNSINGTTLQSLNTSNLPAGVYMVSVVSATKTVSQKVVVK